MAIGFHVPTKAPQAKHRKASDPADMLLQFDSGDGISLHEATHNTIALGSSGTGKTSSVILPALHSLLRAGYAGLVVDIKGNFTEQAKALAKHFGREADIVEFGTGKHATPINILDGMDSRQVFDFLRILTVTPFAGQSHSLDWHLKGVRQAADCLELLRIMHGHCSDISADLGTLEQLVNDATLAASMFKYSSKNVSASKSREYRELFRRVNNDTFHLCAQKEGRGGSMSSGYSEQVTWRLGAIRDALSLFREAPGVLRNFAASGASGIDLARLIYDEGKVVVLRFGVAAGGVGALLARHMLEAFYAATYQRGLALPEGKRVFLVGDEAQDFLDLNPYNKNNDNTFTAKAREFQVIQVLGTQSVASLGSRGAGAAQVNEYLNNFSNKLILFNDDPLTLNLAERFDPHFSFQDMGQGQCLAIHFDAEKHRPVCTHEGLQQGHDAVKGLIPQDQSDMYIFPTMSDPIQALEDVFNEVCQIAAQPHRAVQAMQPITAEESESTRGIVKHPLRNVTPGEIFEDLFGGASEGSQKEARLIETPSTEKEPTEFQKFMEQHPDTFHKSPLKGYELPKGWLSVLVRGTFMVKSMELSVIIKGFNISGNRLYAIGDSASTGLKVLNELLAATRCTCPACGKQVGQSATPEGDFSEAGDELEGKVFAFCDDCLWKAGFVTEKTDQRTGTSGCPTHDKNTSVFHRLRRAGAKWGSESRDEEA